MMDSETARILANLLDEPDRYPEEDEYPGEPSIHPERQWQILRAYYDQDFRRATGEQTADPIRPIEALAVARLVVEQTRRAYWGLVADAREAGASWTEIGHALGTTRQSAHEMYARDLVDAEARGTLRSADRYRALLGTPDDTPTAP